MDDNKCFSLFNSSYIDKEIKKNVLLNNITNKEDREIIEKFVENVYIKYCIKADKINKGAEENFSEIEVIEININNYRAIYDIYGILLSIIPYPILAIFRYNNRISIAVSNRILSEGKNNKGRIFISYLIKKENISDYLKIDIDNCKTLKTIYEKWIFNVENVATYYEKIDSVMQIIEKGLHIKSEEVLENLESYIVKYCGTYNMKPKEGWKSKLEKYSDSPVFIKKVETHLLWEYLSENAFLKNKLIDFSSWKDFKESCSYDSLNNLYYSQYNRILNDEGFSDINKYIVENDGFESHNENIRRNYRLINEIKKENKRLMNKKQKNESQDPNKDLSKLYNITEELKNNRDFMLQLIENKGSLFIIEASDELKNDETFILRAMNIDLLCFKYASEGLKNNKEFMLQAIEKDCLCILYASEELKNDKDFMVQAIEKNSFCISWTSDELRNDKETMLQVVEKCSLCYECIGEELKNNTEFSMQTILKDVFYSIGASEKLKNNQELILQTIENGVFCLQYINDELKNDKNFMLQAIRKNSLCIAYASEALKNDKDFMLQAIKNYSLCITHASIELKNNKEFMLQAIKKHSECIAYASEELKNDIDFILKVINIDSFNISFVSNRCKSQREFMIQAVKKDSLCIIDANEELKNDKEFMLQSIEKDGLCIICAGSKLRNDRDFMLQAIEKYSECIAYASDELKNDEEFLKKVEQIKKNK